MLTSTEDLTNLTTATSVPSGFEGEANDTINRVLTTISGSLSLLGTSLIIATYIAWKDFRSTSRRILVYISIADFIIAGSDLVGVWHQHTESDVLCKAQSFVTTTACLCSFFWTTFLAAFMYMTVAKKKRNKAEIMLKVFHAFGWGIPIIIVGTALGLKKLGNDKDFYTSGWCWISSALTKEERYLWMLLTGKAWEIAAYVLCSTFYLMLKCHIHKEVMKMFSNARGGGCWSFELNWSLINSKLQLQQIRFWKGILRIRDLTQIRCGIRENTLISWQDSGFNCSPGSGIRQNLGTRCWIFFACLSFVKTKKIQMINRKGQSVHPILQLALAEIIF